MASKFSLALYPWVYVAQFKGSNGKNSDGWSGNFREQEHLSPAEEAALSAEERQALLGRRNWIDGLPLVNYTTQYGFGCFEGLKAFPQKDGSLKMFRPDKNGERMHRSMDGLRMPPIPVELFVEAVRGMVARNRDLGFRPGVRPGVGNGQFPERKFGVRAAVFLLGAGNWPEPEQGAVFCGDLYAGGELL